MTLELNEDQNNFKMTHLPDHDLIVDKYLSVKGVWYGSKAGVTRDSKVKYLAGCGNKDLIKMSAGIKTVMDEEVHCTEIFLLDIKNVMIMTSETQVYAFNTFTGAHDHIPLNIHTEGKTKLKLLQNPYTVNKWSA